MLIGGANLLSVQQCSNKTWFFNHQNKKWNLGPVLGTGRCRHTAGIIKDRKTNEEFVAVVGGSPTIMSELAQDFKSVELLDLQSKEYAWKYGIEFKHYISEIQMWFLNSFLFTGPNLIHGISGHAMVKINDDLIVIGGSHGHEDASSALYRLTCSNGEFQWFMLPQKLKIPRYRMVATVIPDDFLGCN